MEINGINYTLDKNTFDEILENYNTNIQLFKQQNTALILNRVEKLHEEDIIQFIAQTLNNQLEEKEILINNEFIKQHYINFAINPEIIEFQKGYTMQVDIVPDIICETVRI